MTEKPCWPDPFFFFGWRWVFNDSRGIFQSADSLAYGHNGTRGSRADSPKQGGFDAAAAVSLVFSLFSSTTQGLGQGMYSTSL